jgi:peptide/nickel transport system substrate-binding protein
VLTIALRNEPADLHGLGPGGKSAGTAEVRPIVQDPLAQRDDRDQVQPVLAVDLPSVERGTWRVLPDGTMEMTWKLRPNVKWQDGAAFTSEDLAFTATVRRDLAFPPPSGRTEQIQSFETPDPQTFLVRWSAAFPSAQEGTGLDPLPKHLLEGLYQAGGATALLSSPALGNEIVGLGPYKLVEWDHGAQMTFTPFADYYRGRPPLDRVVVRFIPENRAQIVSVVEGEADVVSPSVIDLETMDEVRPQWAEANIQMKIGLTGRLNLLELQLRPDATRPRNGFTVQQVRQAFYQSVDRQTLAEMLTDRIAPAADSWVRPGSVLRKDLETAIPQYAFDIFQAGRLLEFAGWTRGADGMLVHQQTGDAFAFEVWTRPGSERLATAVADAWTATGARMGVHVIPADRANDREYEALHAGPLLSQVPDRQIWETRLHSRNVAAAANNWNGANRSGYANARMDDVLDRLQVTIDPGGQVAYQRQLLFEVMGDLPIMPLYWEVVAALVRPSVRGAIVAGPTMTANIYEWDKAPE